MVKNIFMALREPNSFNLPCGKPTAYRIVPYRRPGKKRYEAGHPIAYHYDQGNCLGVCLKESLDRPCLFCDIKERSRVFSKLVFRLLVNVVEVDWTDRVYILALPQSVYTPIVDYFLEENRNIFHPEHGRIIRIGSEGQGFDRRYSVDITDDTFPIEYEAVMDQIIDPASEIRDPEPFWQERILVDLFKNGRI